MLPLIPITLSSRVLKRTAIKCIFEYTIGVPETEMMFSRYGSKIEIKFKPVINLSSASFLVGYFFKHLFSY